MSKGSKRRPAQVVERVVRENWDRAFGPAYCLCGHRRAQHGPPGALFVFEECTVDGCGCLQYEAEP